MSYAGVRFRDRYWGQSGHALVQCVCLLMTRSRHSVFTHHVTHGRTHGRHKGNRARGKKDFDFHGLDYDN